MENNSNVDRVMNQAWRREDGVVVPLNPTGDLPKEPPAQQQVEERVPHDASSPSVYNDISLNPNEVASNDPQSPSREFVKLGPEDFPTVHHHSWLGTIVDRLRGLASSSDKHR